MPLDQRIMPGLAQSGLEQVQDHLRIAGSFLSHELCIASRVRASASVGISRSSKTLTVEKISQRSMIVPGRFETDQAPLVRLHADNRPTAGNPQRLFATRKRCRRVRSGRFDQHIVSNLLAMSIATNVSAWAYR